MEQVNSLNYTCWERKHHMVFIPKYRLESLFRRIHDDVASAKVSEWAPY